MEGASMLLKVLVISLLDVAGGWYVPGVLPESYAKGEPVRIQANSMTSSSGLFPYGAYSIKTCAPSDERRRREKKQENLGELLWGDQIEPSLYQADMLVNVPCTKLCSPMVLSESDAKLIERRIENNYRGNLILDNLPIVQESRVSEHHAPTLAVGFPLGMPSRLTQDKKTRLYNHLDIVITYHRPATAAPNAEEWRIVGFFCTPRSIKHTDPAACDANREWQSHDHDVLHIRDAGEVIWSYSVTWKEDVDTEWATRWDAILRSNESDAKIHWFSIVNSLLIVLFLTGMVAIILLRSLHKDFNRYDDANMEDTQEETGWKLCHGDVFRPPRNPSLLAIIIGTGCQLLGMSVVTLVFALLGFLSPANRGALLYCMLLLFDLLGGYAGYITAYLLKGMSRQSWFAIFGVGLSFPGIVFSIYFCINLVQWSKNATSAIPGTSLFTLFAMWFGISLPLVLLGGVLGYKKEPWTPPCQTNPVPRHVPPQNWYLRGPFIIPVSGVLPFGAVFIELAFILSSLWQGRVYYVFGFLSLVFLIAVVTCCEISIVLTYFQLCYEDYNWWWKSFFCSGISGIYIMLYVIFYYFNTLTISQASSTVLYFGYMSIVSIFFTIASGTCGFLASFAFVRVIYARVKID